MWKPLNFPVVILVLLSISQGCATSAIHPVAQDALVLIQSPEPTTVYTYSPGITTLPSGRLVATMEFGGKKLKEMPFIKKDPAGNLLNGRIFTSDDHGKRFSLRGSFPLTHARPFYAGDRVYVLGHRGDLGIIVSEDNGTTWSEACWLTEGEHWHQAPSNVHYANGKIYLVMEKKMDPKRRGWPVACLAPIVMAAPVEADLTKRESWTFSNPLTYEDLAKAIGGVNGIASAFYTPGLKAPKNLLDKRGCALPGWLETNVVQFTDPDNLWFDPAGRTFYLWMRAHTGSTNMACIAKAVEAEDGAITVGPALAPSGQPMLYVPCPGGQLKFHILYDEKSQLFWLVANQATDSMTRPEALKPDRYNLPNNERHRLALYFSKNCIDWCFAALVADTGNPRQARNYPAMTIEGDTLHILARSGSAHAKSAHDGDIITLHSIPDFRSLVY